MSTFRLTYREQPGAAFQFEPEMIKQHADTFLWRLLLLSALAYFVWNDNVSIKIDCFSIQNPTLKKEFAGSGSDHFGFFGGHAPALSSTAPEALFRDNPNFLFGPDFSHMHQIPETVVQDRVHRCHAFIKRFNPVAIAEMRHFGVPASILLAQALLASKAGEEQQAVKRLNFFLRNNATRPYYSPALSEVYEVDTNYPPAQYTNLWESFRAQSLFFAQTAPYDRLIQNRISTPATWVIMLQTDGYADDANYGEKLKALIDAFDLEQFDRRK